MENLFQDDHPTKQVDYTELLHKVSYRTKIVLRGYWWVLPIAVALEIGFKAVESLLKAPTYYSEVKDDTSILELIAYAPHLEHTQVYLGAIVERINSLEQQIEAVYSA
ncbi:MAG: hypothetical protein ACI9ZV_000739 [Candidatus Azotimanducaceae bacterium]|jgi:hypothetical protein